MSKRTERTKSGVGEGTHLKTISSEQRTSPYFNFPLSLSCELMRTWSETPRGPILHAPHWKGRIFSVPSDCQDLSASHSSWWEGWLRKWQKTEMTKKCCLFSASNKAFSGEQKWSEPLMRCRLPKKTHGQIPIFQVAGGRNVTVHWSLQHGLFLHLLIKLRIYREVTLA